MRQDHKALPARAKHRKTEGQRTLKGRFTYTTFVDTAVYYTLTTEAKLRACTAADIFNAVIAHSFPERMATVKAVLLANPTATHQELIQKLLEAEQEKASNGNG